MTEPTHLIISRPSGTWRDKLRAYQLTVDGAQAGRIRSGETLDLPISPGRHWAEARIDWSGSRRLEFEAAAGAAVRLKVEPNGNLLNATWQIFTRRAWLRLTHLE